jgi:hypothetical protein
MEAPTLGVGPEEEEGSVRGVGCVSGYVSALVLVWMLGKHSSIPSLREIACISPSLGFLATNSPPNT